MGYQHLSEEQELILVNEYRQGASVKSLMEKYGYASKKSITDKVKKHFPDEYKQIIEEARTNRKEFEYSLKVIDSEFDAYYIGLLLTDGYIAREREVGIDLIDEDCIQFLSKAIGQHYKSYAPSSSNAEAKLKRHRLLLSDRALVTEVSRFGIVPNKTDNLQPPHLLPEEEKYIPYIIRGIIDGDGCIYQTSYGAPAFYIITKSEAFAKWLIDTFKNKLYFTNINLTITNNGLYRIETAEQNNIFKLLALIYNKPFGMNRKYLKLRKMFRDYNNDFLADEEQKEDGIVQTTTN